MIKANELRIGNCIYQSPKYGNGKLSAYQIYNLSILNSGGLVADYYKEFKPILLTEEILLKCGFKVSNTYWIELNGGTHHIDLHCINKEYYPILVQEPEMSSEEAQVINLHKIQYLHQLQNIYFALTGTELEVNL